MSDPLIGQPLLEGVRESVRIRARKGVKLVVAVSKWDCPMAIFQLKFRLNRNQRPLNLAGGDLKRVKFQYIQLQKNELYSNERYHIAARSSRDLCLF